MRTADRNSFPCYALRTSTLKKPLYVRGNHSLTGGNGEGRHIGLPLRLGPDSSWGTVYGAHLCVRPLAMRQTQERGRSRRPLVSEWLDVRAPHGLT